MVKVRRWPRQEAPISCLDLTLQEGSGRCGPAHPLSLHAILFAVFCIFFVFEEFQDSL